MNKLRYALFTCLVLLPVQARADSVNERAAQILQATGVKGGLIGHVGCGDGRLTAALRISDAYIVHGLDGDASKVAQARRHIQSRGLDGKVSVELWEGRGLPYADNLVNLLVVQDPGRLAKKEIQRVLAPLGVAYVKQGDRWAKTVKTWPEEIDEWTHFLHDASGNAVAHDSVVAPPKSVQWLGGPLWSRSHEYDSSLCAMVSSGGRLFYIFDEGPTGVIDPRVPDEWTLIARDAFNGVILWKRPIPDWGWRAWKKKEMQQADWRRMPSQRFRLPASIPRRLVAAADRLFVTLGYQAPVTALDPATGRTLMTYAGTEHTDEIVYQDGLLVLCIRAPNDGGQAQRPQARANRQQAGPGFVMGLDATTGRRLWQTQPGVIVPLSLATGAAGICYQDQEAVVCLDAATGRQKWRSPTGAANNSIWGGNETLVMHDQVVLCANRNQLTAMSSEDGRELWSVPQARGFGVANPPDVFVADGLVWRGSGRPETLHSIEGCDPLTGQVTRTIDLRGTITHGHHARCYRSKATDSFLLLPKRGVEFIDIHGSEHTRQNWVRGACRYGVLPCNGLLYSTPHPCFCYAGVKLGGFLALSSKNSAPAAGLSGDAGDRLTRGPAYLVDVRSGTTDGASQTLGQQSVNQAAASPHNSAGGVDSNKTSGEQDDWTMYRHDAKRSGSSPTTVNPLVAPLWTAKLHGKLTQPIIAGTKLFVARIDAGQLCCLDAVSGESNWDFSTGGRIDSSPTYHEGHLLFGSADGYVYCLRASDGALAWRFQAAPSDRRVVAYGQVESAWPVHGSILVMNDTAYFTAGRSSFLDGGIFLYGLDPVTGRIRCETRLDGPHENMDRVDENAYAMEGAKSDILVTDGTLIYMFHNAFNQQLEKQPTPVQGESGVRNLGVREFGEHLFSNAGFLDDSWFSRSHWMIGDRWTGFNFTHQSPKAGQLIVFDDKSTYAVKCFSRRNMLSPLFFPATDGYFLVADRNSTRPVLVPSDGKNGPEFIRWLPQEGKLQTCWNLGVGFARSNPAQWITNVPVRIRAMVRTASALFAAGPPDVCDPKDPAAAWEGRRGAVLLAINPESGRKLFETKLKTPPIFDGMSAAQGRLYMADTAGQVLCFGSGRRLEKKSRMTEK